MRNKKASRNRIEVRVEAERETIPTLANPEIFPWEVRVYDAAGLVSKTYCISRSNVASKATRSASLALNVPEGRIKINRVEYS